MTEEQKRKQDAFIKKMGITEGDLKSWIGALKNDYTIFFQAAADAEKAADWIVSRYRDRFMDKDLTPEQQIPENKETEKKQSKRKGR